MSKYLYSCVIISLLCGASQAFAFNALDQDEGLSATELAQLYGMGVHAYFGGQPEQAEALLTTAIDSGSKDPRNYFFRGLARLQQENKEEAAADFKTAADLEANATTGGVNVNRALMRVQGAARIQIEQARAIAKKEAAERRKREMEERYNRIKANEDRVLDRSRGNQGQGGGGA